ncbi:MAG: hypothetical protein ACO39X_07165, partial [Candidatus Nanopelagicaceae bacterium]
AAKIRERRGAEGLVPATGVAVTEAEVAAVLDEVPAIVEETPVAAEAVAETPAEESSEETKA